MTTLLLVRHGRSTSNSAGTLAGRTPGVHLDETGRSQAMSVGERLRGVQPTAVVCSPIERCQETLELVLDSAGLAERPPVHVDERFTECDYGRWSNRKLVELADEELWKTIQARPSQVRFPDGESMAEMAERVRQGVADWCTRLAAEAPEGTEPVLLVVSHGDPIKTMLSQALNQDFDDFQRIMVDPASISIVHQPREGAAVVVATNSTAGRVADRLPKQALAPQLGGGLGSQQEDPSTGGARPGQDEAD